MGEELIDKELEEKIEKEVEEDRIAREERAISKLKRDKAVHDMGINLLNSLPSLGEILNDKNMVYNLTYALKNKVRKMDSLPILKTVLLIEVLKELVKLNSYFENQSPATKEQIVDSGIKKIDRKKKE